jgi:hypothetical protein
MAEKNCHLQPATCNSAPCFALEDTMSKDRSLVRASDIGAWTFCNRAWWLANIQEAPHENPAQLDAGNRVHHAHGRLLVRSDRLQLMGGWLLAVGMILSGIYLLLQLFIH